MVLQNVVACGGSGKFSEMYVRASYKERPESPGDSRIWVPRGGTMSTDTYMNAFDIGAWKKYTGVSELSLAWRVWGKGKIRVWWETEKFGAVCIGEKNIGSRGGGWQEIKHCVGEFGSLSEGLLYFGFQAEQDTWMEAWFETGERPVEEVRISLVICTYRRKGQLEGIIGVLKAGKAGWLQTVVIDNASELKDSYGEGIKVCHNPNTGGSGGFSRGMEETVGRLEDFPATHVVFMDDDVILQWESLCRLYAFLSYRKEGYAEEPVAGRMFRMDRPYVQYTASEIWNGGNIRHIGWNLDMADRDSLWAMNGNEGGEYGGWWFACYPIGFVENNRPLPFFLHCDDVEYGLRHGGTPIILNGIQVWHETYEYRQSPVVAYYDYRNSLVVNDIFGTEKNGGGALWEQFMGKITEAHNREDYLLEYFLIRAFGDYLKGRRWFMDKNNERLHAGLQRKRKANRYMNSLRWRKAGIIYWSRRKKKHGKYFKENLYV